MQKIIHIPTANQAREMIETKSQASLSKMWNQILCEVETRIDAAVGEWKYNIFLPEYMFGGIPHSLIYNKLSPMLTGMGYKVILDSDGIVISWEGNSES
jgi:hypothetical protein